MEFGSAKTHRSGAVVGLDNQKGRDENENEKHHSVIATDRDKYESGPTQWNHTNHACSTKLESLLHCTLYTLLEPSSPLRYPDRSEWIILRRNFLDKVIANHWYFLHYICSYFWDLGEEEDGEDACCDAEAGGYVAAVSRCVSTTRWYGSGQVGLSMRRCGSAVHTI